MTDGSDDGDGAEWGVLPPSERADVLDVGAVDPANVLAEIRLLGVRTWRDTCRSEAGRVRLGPPAAAFCGQLPVADDPSAVTPGDADAVAFAAIQGLDARLDEQHDSIDESHRRLREHRERLDDQRRDIEALRERLESLQAELSRRRREDDH